MCSLLKPITLSNTNSQSRLHYKQSVVEVQYSRGSSSGLSQVDPTKVKAQKLYMQPCSNIQVAPKHNMHGPSSWSSSHAILASTDACAFNYHTSCYPNYVRQFQFMSFKTCLFLECNQKC